MLGKILINIGVIAIPLLPLLRYGTREHQIGLSIFMATLLCLWGYYSGNNKPIKNYWLFIFIAFMLFSAWQAPKPLVEYAGLNISNFWIWKPLFMSLVYLGMFSTIRSIDFTTKDKKILFNIIASIGFVIGLHCIGNSFHLHQWYGVKETANSTQKHIASFLGQPSLVAAYLAMLIPIAIYVKRYFFAAVMIVAVLLTRSDVALVAMILSLIILLRKKFMVIGFVIVLLSAIGIFFSPLKINDNARFAKWEKIMVNLKEPFLGEKSYPYTGFGPGSFKYTYEPEIKNKRYSHAHNEYMETLSENGYIGAAFLFMALLMMFLNLRINSFEDKILLSSFVCIALCAGGTFVWRLGPHMFNSVLILGLLNKGDKNVSS